MEELSTPVENTNVDTSVTSAPETTDTTENVTEPTNEPNATAENDQTGEQAPETTGNEKLYAGKYKSIEDLEKGYKEAEKSVTKVAELEKRIKEFESKQPKYVNEDGKFNPEIKAKYDRAIDGQEFQAYINLARGLDADSRAEVEKLLTEAERVYNPYDKSAYFKKLVEAKNYFPADVIENIAAYKKNLENKLSDEMKNYEDVEKKKKADICAAKIKEVPELYELVNPESAEFSQDVLNILEAVFSVYQDVNIDDTMKAINAIKDLGVKQYKAKQEFEQAKKQANISTGNIVTTPSGLPTAEELKDPKVFNSTVKKYGMDKVDQIIAKG